MSLAILCNPNYSWEDIWRSLRKSSHLYLSPLKFYNYKTKLMIPLKLSWLLVISKCQQAFEFQQYTGHILTKQGSSALALITCKPQHTHQLHVWLGERLVHPSRHLQSVWLQHNGHRSPACCFRWHWLLAILVQHDWTLYCGTFRCSAVSAFCLILFGRIGWNAWYRLHWTLHNKLFQTNQRKTSSID